MRGSELLFLATATAVLLAEDFRGRESSFFLSEIGERRRATNVTLRVGAIFTREDIERGENVAFQVKSHPDFQTFHPLGRFQAKFLSERVQTPTQSQGGKSIGEKNHHENPPERKGDSGRCKFFGAREEN